MNATLSAVPSLPPPAKAGGHTVAAGFSPPKLSYAGMVPHRYPMRLVDRLEVIEPRSYGRGIKQVSVNDTMLSVYGKQRFVPNSLVVDALGQVAIAVMAPGDGTTPEVWYLATIDDVEFGAPARPGDTIVLEAKIARVWKTTVRIAIHARVAERTVARGVMVLATGELN